MKVVTLLILLIVLSFSILAQTSHEMDAEAEKWAKDFVNQRYEAAKNDLLKKTSFDKAMEILIVEPYDPRLLFHIGLNYVDSNILSGDKFPTAVYLKYIELVPGEPAGYSNFADFLTNQGYVAEADKYYAKAIELNSTFSNNFRRGRAAFQNRNYRQCIESMTKAAGHTPEQGDQRFAFMYLSLCQSMTGDKANAAASLQKAVSIGGDQIRNHVEVKSGAYSNPVKCEKNSDKMWRKNDDAKTKSPDKRYAVFFQYISCFPNDKAANLAGEDIARAIPELGYWWKYFNIRANGWINFPLDRIDEEDQKKFYMENTLPFMIRSLVGREFDKALKHSAKIPLILPKVADHFYIRALMFLEMPEYKLLAWREANRLLAFNRNSPSARAIRARVYYEVKNNREKALAEIDEGFKYVLPERTPDLYFARGKIYYGEKQYAQAAADFEAVLKVNPNYPQAAFYKNLALNPQKNEDAAIAARNRETGIKNQMDKIATAVNIAMSNLTYPGNLKLTPRKVCEIAKNTLSVLNSEHYKLRQLEPSIPAAGELRDHFKKGLSAISVNIKNVSEASKNCP